VNQADILDEDKIISAASCTTNAITPVLKVLYDKYKVLAEEEEERGVFFVGRLANYKYYNMDAAIENALNACDRILQSPFIIPRVHPLDAEAYHRIKDQIIPRE
jgi:hypothetical protein